MVRAEQNSLTARLHVAALRSLEVRSMATYVAHKVSVCLLRTTTYSCRFQVQPRQPERKQGAEQRVYTAELKGWVEQWSVQKSIPSYVVHTYVAWGVSDKNSLREVLRTHRTQYILRTHRTPHTHKSAQLVRRHRAATCANTPHIEASRIVASPPPTR